MAAVHIGKHAERVSGGGKHGLWLWPLIWLAVCLSAAESFAPVALPALPRRHAAAGRACRRPSAVSGSTMMLWGFLPPQKRREEEPAASVVEINNEAEFESLLFRSVLRSWRRIVAQRTRGDRRL